MLYSICTGCKYVKGNDPRRCRFCSEGVFVITGDGAGAGITTIRGRTPK